MQSAISIAASHNFHGMFAGHMPVPQFVVLNVTRENLVEDTLREIMQYGSGDLKKPLKVYNLIFTRMPQAKNELFYFRLNFKVKKLKMLVVFEKNSLCYY